jgi:hypothetical protein
MFNFLKRRQQLKILVLIGLGVAIFHMFIDNNKAKAQTASASGSSSLSSGSTIVETFVGGVLADRTTTNGIISSVSGEVVLPSGYFFNGPVIVTPTYSSLNATTSVVNSISIGAGSPTLVDKSASFSRAVAEILTNVAADPTTVTDIEQVTAIIKAGAGVNGLD